MLRNGVRVRDATFDDLPALIRLGEELRDPAGARGARPPAAAGHPGLATRYEAALADPARRLVLAVTEEDEVLGMALLTIASTSALIDLSAVQMSHVVVASRHQRRGAGKALVAAAAAYADDVGVDRVVVSVQPGLRDAHRFYARLGFAPLVVRRVAPVAVLRRHLGASGHRPAEQVIQRRLRGRTRRRVLAGHTRLRPVTEDE